ncbi:hypothetical protein QYE76_059795 [Lolium multiflorum]|uniref:Transposase (putative) gypsy type domain-containing protein n=1 Tax=Lolium multiflorum TaxID=4521 RepID=A0AAD8W4S7_LOLMU|nr:hypothetical protein QYE76_059795 [Lolium multiflorum]
MGKKKGIASFGATASAPKASLDWTASTISKREENKMRSLGLISSAESDFVHPGSVSRPKPPKGFTVMFVAFLQRGLSLPAHEFLRCLLFSYGIQLWQLTPNSILHLSIFITVCEAFLGIDPHWGLWRKIVYVKHHSGNDGPHVVDGVGFIASSIALCYPPTPESGAAPEDDDASEETEDDRNVLEDSDASGDEAPEDDALIKSKHRRKINEDLMTTAESSPSGRDDDDADAIPSPAPSRETSAPQVTKGPSRLFAEEDDLELFSSEEDDDVPLSKRAKIISDKAESAKESMPSTAESDHTATPPPRTTVAKVKASSVNPSASASPPPSSSDHVRWHALATARTCAGVLRPLPEGPGPTSSGSLPALRVARRCSPVGFGRQHILARPVGHSTTTASTSAAEMANALVTYEELPEEHKKKYDEIKAAFESDLIGSFEKTRTHGIRWKGFSPEGVLDEVDLSTPSEERTRALRQEVNYMVAHSLHRHSESLVNAFERIAVRVVEEIMKHQYSPSGPALGTHQGEIPFQTRPPLPFALAAPEPPGSPAYVVYKIGGDPGDCQFLQEPPKEIPHGYVCTYVLDCNNLARTNQIATHSGTNQIATRGISGADADK